MPYRSAPVAIFFVMLGLCDIHAAEQTKTFKAGAYAVDITPTKFPVIVNGMLKQRTANKAFDALHSRALVLDDGQTRVALVVVDSAVLPRELLDQAKEMAAKATGIPTDHMLISATHTHSAPSAMPALGTPADPEYPGFLMPLIARSIQLASNQLRPAQIGWTVVKDPRHTRSRNSIKRSDRIDKDPFGEPTVRANMYAPEPIGPSGPVDDEISMLAVQTTDGKPIALLANYATHYYGHEPVSSDYYGRFCDQFAKLAAPDQQDPMFVGIMSQGTSGDIHGGGAGNIDNYANEVAEVAFEAHQKIQYHSWVPLTMREVKQTFSRRVPNEARLAWAKQIDATLQGRLPGTYPEIYAREQLYLVDEPERELKLQAIGIGDLGITAAPAEVYSLSGIKLKLQSPFAQTINIELANGCEGYIPPPEQHVLGGYTTWPARSTGLEVEAEPKIVETLLSLLEQVSGKPRKKVINPKGTYTESVLDSKPVGYWRMTELAGQQAGDASGNDHAAHYEDGVVFYLDGPPAAGLSAADQINRCAHFAGGRMKAELPKIGSTYSAEFWFWNGFPNEARAVTGYLFSRGLEGHQDVGDHLGIGGTFTKPGRLCFFNGNRHNQVVVGRTIVEPNTWNHVVLVRDGKQVRVYLNGNAEPELSGEAEVSLGDDSQWFFGGRSDNFSNLEGKLDEAAIYDRALTAEEVALHYRSSEMPPKVNAPLEVSQSLPGPPADGLAWQPLLPGNRLNGWYSYLQNQGKNNDPQHVFHLEDGVLHIYKDVANGTPMPFGFICTEQEYSHYRLRFQYRWGKNRFAPRTEALRDSGLLYHCVGPDGAFLGVWPRCVEYQVQEGDTGDTYPVGATISTTVIPDMRRFAESSNGGVPFTGTVPIRHNDPCLEVEGWNSCEVIVEGDKATHILNGKINNRCYDIRQPDPNDPKKLIPLTKGRILLQAEGAEVFYRNIEIVLLPEPKAPAEEAQSAAPQPTSAADSLSKLKVRDGFEVELVAAEPLVQDPVAIEWGPDGKLWVAEMADYPLGFDNQGGACGRIRYLEDADGDGKYDKSTLFLDKVNFPNGIIPWKKGVLVTAAPEIFYAEDTDGDGHADVRKTLYSGFIEGNPQLRVNGLRWGLDGWLYCANGFSGGVIKSEQTGATVDIRGRDLRIHPDTGRMDPVAGVSEFGRNRNAYGDWFGCDNSNPLWHFVLEDRYTRRNPHVAPPDARQQLMTPANPLVFPISQPQKRYHSLEQSGRFTSACAAMVYGDEWLFPASSAQHAFVCEPVHNLVHHETISDDGVTYRSVRAPGEEQNEFLASTDPWFRPVMTRTGPDGALWVVDMYRYMIEHPAWLPPEGKKELAPYFRLGEDRGRIYRIVRRGQAPRTIPRLEQLTPPELVAALDSPNDWQRDMVQQLLTWRNETSIVSLLEQMAKQSKLPQTRLQALCTLDTLTQLSPTTIHRAFEDSHPAVRRQALRLAEPQGDTEIITHAIQLLGDKDPKVLLQLALTLGAWNDSRVGVALGNLAAQSTDDFMSAAVLSSLRSENIAATVSTLASSKDRRHIRLVLEKVIEAAAEMQQDRIVEDMLLTFCNSPEFESSRTSFVNRILNILAKRGKSMGDLLNLELQNRLATLCQAARQLAAQEQGPTSERAAAVGLLLRESSYRDADLALLGDLLNPQVPLDVQSAVVERLGQQAASTPIALVLKNWKQYGPTLRGQILTMLLNRSDRVALLLDAIEQQQIAAADIDLTRRQQLTTLSDPALRDRANQLLALATNADRNRIIDEMRPVLSLTGDTARGESLFQKNCSACHKLKSVGYEIGPNLAALTDRSPGSLLTAILDPSRVIETRYLNYIAVTQDGRNFTGILEAESGSSISLLGEQGKRQTILRVDLESLSSTGKSLMPEGFEKTISPAAMADLLTYLSAP